MHTFTTLCLQDRTFTSVFHYTFRYKSLQKYQMENIQLVRLFLSNT
jgi:hypothetical protein